VVQASSLLSANRRKKRNQNFNSLLTHRRRLIINDSYHYTANNEYILYLINIHIYIITNDASLSRLPPPYIPLPPSYLYTPYNASFLCPLRTCQIKSLDGRPGAPKSIRSHFLLDQFLGDAVIPIGSLVYVYICMYSRNVCMYVCMYVRYVIQAMSTSRNFAMTSSDACNRASRIFKTST
jgi:hypothetical protein